MTQDINLTVTLKIYRHLNPEIPKNHIWVIGNFDGLHKGHQALINRAKQIAVESSRKVGILSFYPHPRQFFDPEKNVIHIMQRSEKIRSLDNMGINYYYIHPFNEYVANLSSQDFCDKIKSQLDPSDIIIGHDFHFGKARSGTPKLLQNFCQNHRINCHIVEPQINNDGTRYASQVIREFLSKGNISQVNAAMHYPYMISGRVIHGKKLARQLGFPTANILPRNLFLPKFGVYGCTITNMDNTLAIANIGVKPTLNEDHRPTLEVHIPNFNGDLYGKKLYICFKKFIRPEQKFSDLQALTDQIKQDIEALV